MDLLVGEASKARQILGWEPQTKFRDLVRLMVDADVGEVQRRHGTQPGSQL